MNLETFIRIKVDSLIHKGYKPKAILLGIAEYIELLNGFKNDEEVKMFLGLPVFMVAGIGFEVLFNYEDAKRNYISQGLMA